MDIAPPIIDSAKLLFFAINDDDVEYTDRISLYVWGSGKDLEPIGEVPGLAIAETYYDPKKYLLMFCDHDWSVKGVIPFTSIEEAKIKAERGYKGISSKWNASTYSDEEIQDFLIDEYDVDPYSEWWTSFCSFCGKSNSEFSKLIAGQSAQICENCIKDFFEVVNKNA